jgi:hypothetical protein
MTTSSDLQLLCDELTQIFPPPQNPKGVNFVEEGTGRWVIARVGSGMYAVQAEYKDHRGGTIQVKMENQITGFAPAVMTALKFSISVADSHRYGWSAV